jgi:threonine synthase
VRESCATFRHESVVPVVKAGPVHLLELFHGPTLAFKDIALQFLGRLFELLLARRGGVMNIVAATSGDTGSAAIHGVRGRYGLRIFVMYPHGRVSPLQERQMTSVLDDNVFNLAIRGNFDDCQAVLKDLFSDLPFKQSLSLGSVNSINWARVLAQVVYYFHGAFRVREATGAARVRFSVPTGNFGDVLAGYFAERMGLPISVLAVATNENDILDRFFRTGVYRRGEVRETLSPSMDIQAASNFERYLYYVLDREPARVRNAMDRFRRTGALDVAGRQAGGSGPRWVSGACDRENTLRTIRRYHADHGYLLDPHSAAGVFVGEQHLSDDEPMICLATAHPAKFPDAIKAATGRSIARHPLLDALSGAECRMKLLPASAAAVGDYIRNHAIC